MATARACTLSFTQTPQKPMENIPEITSMLNISLRTIHFLLFVQTVLFKWSFFLVCVCVRVCVTHLYKLLLCVKLAAAVLPVAVCLVNHLWLLFALILVPFLLHHGHPIRMILRRKKKFLFNKSQQSSENNLNTSL